MFFSDILGQEMPIKIIQNAIKRKKCSHAYLFVGPEGVGKKSTAFAFARLLNCKEKVGTDDKGEKHASNGAHFDLQGMNIYDSCGECISCKKIKKGYSGRSSIRIPNAKWRNDWNTRKT